MTFKKNDEFTKQMASKGGKIGGKVTQKIHPNSRETARNNCKRANTDKDHQSKAGKMSRIGENLKAAELKNKYGNIFLPQSVCDRICFNEEGKVLFIEIKQKGQKLKEKQEEFKNICNKYGYNYIIEYIN